MTVIKKNMVFFGLTTLIVLIFSVSSFATVEGVRVSTPDTCWYQGNIIDYPVSIEWTDWSQRTQCNAEYLVRPHHDTLGNIYPYCDFETAPETEMCSFDMVVTFDARRAQAVTVSNCALLDDNWHWGDVYYEVDNSRGTINISIAAANCQDLTRLTDPTELVKIGFLLTGYLGQDIGFNVESFIYNEVDPWWVYIDDEQDLTYVDNQSIGDFIVCGGVFTSGQITYMANGYPICDADVTLNYLADPNAVDPPDIDDITVKTYCDLIGQGSDLRGSYFLPDAISEYHYDLTAWKDTPMDYANAVTAFDASLVLRHMVGLFSFTEYHQDVAADVSGNGEVSAYDASLILQWLVHQFTYFPKNRALGTNWVFVADDGSYGLMPPNEAWEWDPLTSSKPNTNFLAVILGDISGNWYFSPKVAEPVGLSLQAVGMEGSQQVFELVGEGTDTYSAQFSVNAPAGDIQVLTGDSNSDWFLETARHGDDVLVAIAGVNASSDGVIARFIVDQNADFTIDNLVINEERLETRLVSKGLGSLPSAFALGNNYPNPFNPTTTISYSVPVAADINISVFNVIGQHVTTLASGRHDAGMYEVVWDGTSTSGTTVSSGVYFYKMTGTDKPETKKMMFLK